MPVKSAAQYGLMQAAAHGMGNSKVPTSVGKDFINATPKDSRSKFAKVLAQKRKKRAN